MHLTDLRPRRVKPIVFTDNPASARVLKKLGFVAVGEGLGESAARVDAYPIILYRLRRDDYES